VTGHGSMLSRLVTEVSKSLVAAAERSYHRAAHRVPTFTKSLAS